MKKIALAGNPNVGKSTVFNALTGMHQHTGNWPGKTVSNAIGELNYRNEEYQIYDLPGTYSLIAHSEEEVVARDFICFADHDAVIVVCDAVLLERNLNLVLQTIEITKNVVVCVNLMDEAKKKKIIINLEQLSSCLGVPVIGTTARSGKGLTELLDAISEIKSNKVMHVQYSSKIEDFIDYLLPDLQGKVKNLNPRWVALNLMTNDSSLQHSMQEYLGYNLLEDKQIRKKMLIIMDELDIDIKEEIVGTLIHNAEKIASEVVTFEEKNYNQKDRKIDRFLTNRTTGLLTMVFLLMVVFWITINGANYPSSLLFELFSKIEQYLYQFADFLHSPSWVSGIVISGVYRVLTWVIAVMLPPMMIFFPLFTLLEDLGYLPRIAFNLDKAFKKCQACGKQALTMCMGFGCNAVGVTGARIIDSPRERLLAILTNVFVPCNGRFPTMISIITMFFVGFESGFLNSITSVLLLTGIILLGIGLTLLISYLLSKTVLKGVPSSFTLELPPYRKPQVGKVIVRSILDRTLFVLGRAIVVAAPAGALIWILANIQVGGITLLSHISLFLDPFGKQIGLDGVIIMAFILGFPANEIVISIIIMAYMATGQITDFSSLESLKELLVANGWTYVTAICTILFSLCHFPCSTTCLTIKKETGSWRWTLLAIILPTVVGIILCFLVKNLCSIF